jgi:hypothetical protein
MGTWGPGNFDSDSACGLIGTFVRQVVGRIGRLFRSKKLDIFRAEDELMPWVAVLLAVCERCKGQPPRPHVIAAWKRQYLDLFDAEIQDIALDEYIPQRRKVIKVTFDKLERIAKRWHGDFRDEDLPQAGAVFLCRLACGRYGACRVLRQAVLSDDPHYGETDVLVAATPWVGTAPPTLDDRRLSQILRTDHHHHRELQLGWLSRPPPKSFRYLGNIAPSMKEEKLRAAVFLRSWEVLPEQVLLQWRWDHDREALLAEEKAQDSE